MAATMLTGMLVMTVAAWCYCIAVSMVRVRAIMLEREAPAAWTRAVAAPAPGAA
jgi:heme exporter protein C